MGLGRGRDPGESASGRQGREHLREGQWGKEGPCWEKRGPGEKLRRGMRKWETFWETDTDTRNSTCILPPFPGLVGWFPTIPHRGALGGPGFGVLGVMRMQ